MDQFAQYDFIDIQSHFFQNGLYSRRIETKGNSRVALSRLDWENPYRGNWETLNDALKDDTIIPAIYVTLFDVDEDIKHIKEILAFWFSITNNREIIIGEIEGALPYQDVDIYDRFFEAVEKEYHRYGKKAVIDLHCGSIDEEVLDIVFPRYREFIKGVDVGEAHDPRQLDKLFRKYSGINFVLSHPLNGIGDYCIMSATELPNVYVGTAARKNERLKLADLINSGPSVLYKKVVFQVDGDPRSLEWWIEKINDEERRRAVLYENAARMLEGKNT